MYCTFLIECPLHCSQTTCSNDLTCQFSALLAVSINIFDNPMVFIIESSLLLVWDGYFLQHLIWQQQTLEDKNCHNRSNHSLTHKSFPCLLLILLCADEKSLAHNQSMHSTSRS